MHRHKLSTYLTTSCFLALFACGGSGPVEADATSTSSETETSTSSGSGDGDSDSDSATTGDGDGDPTTGDGDGDPTTGDGDGDPVDPARRAWTKRPPVRRSVRGRMISATPAVRVCKATTLPTVKTSATA